MNLGGWRSAEVRMLKPGNLSGIRATEGDCKLKVFFRKGATSDEYEVKWLKRGISYQVQGRRRKPAMRISSGK